MGQRAFVPLYEYVCRRCSGAFEELVFGQTSPRCPGCAATDVDRVMSVVSVGRSKETAPCGTCGDVRGPGACAMD
jgi:putative FmdB family regulatory protein